jgi:hypothetical protein
MFAEDWAEELATEGIGVSGTLKKMVRGFAEGTKNPIATSETVATITAIVLSQYPARSLAATLLGQLTVEGKAFYYGTSDAWAKTVEDGYIFEAGDKSYVLKNVVLTPDEGETIIEARLEEKTT